MLEITIVGEELYDEINERFIQTLKKPITIKMEHSLVAMDKWESKFKKPFMHSEKTDDEIKYYFKCMTITQNVDLSIFDHLSVDNINDINEYIQDNQTATFFNNLGSGKMKGTARNTIVTAELIYYWMIVHNIPTSWEKKHISKLLTLIRVCTEKNAPPEKRSSRDILQENAALAAKRRAKYGTKG